MKKLLDSKGFFPSNKFADKLNVKLVPREMLLPKKK